MQYGSQSDSWTELATKPHLENEELIIAHTYLNAQVGNFCNDRDISNSPKISKLKWVDHPHIENMSEEMRNDKKIFHQYLVTNESEKDLIYKENPE